MEFETPFIMTCYGKPKAGKSHFMKYLTGRLLSEGKIDYVYVFSGTAFNDFFQEFVDPKYINQGWDTQKMKKIEKLAIETKKRGKQWLIIIDDCLGEKAFKSCASYFESLLANHRHYGFNFIMATQHPNRLTTVAPAVTTHAILFPMKGAAETKPLWEKYGQSYGDYKSFYELLNKLPKHVCLCVRPAEETVEESYRKLRAPKDIPAFYAKNLIGK
jgi:hypothetical protein